MTSNPQTNQDTPVTTRPEGTIHNPENTTPAIRRATPAARTSWHGLDCFCRSIGQIIEDDRLLDQRIGGSRP